MKLFVLAIFVISMASMSDAALPKKGNVVVIVYGNHQVSSSTIDLVENTIINRLLGNGYKVVDREIQRRIRREKALELAMNDDVEAIKRLGSQYGYSTLLTVQIGDIRYWRDNYGFVESTASLMTKAMATSNGVIIYSDSVSISKVDHREVDASQLAVEAASLLANKMM